MARRLYHWLPVPLSTKWALRARLQPVFQALQRDPSARGVALGVFHAMVKRGPTAAFDTGYERGLQASLRVLARPAATYGPATHWFALPFLSTGGAEQVALNLSRAVRALRPAQSVVLLVTDRPLVSERMSLPEGVLCLVFDDYLPPGSDLHLRQRFLHDLLRAIRPAAFHNINSESAWHLILAEGERLQRYTRLHASIFAFQFGPDGRTPVGFAAYFLARAMPVLASLTSDNQRFIDDAAARYRLSPADRARMHVLYQPCRLFALGGTQSASQLNPRPVAGEAQPRLRVLWAGRLDAEKRIDLFLDVVRACPFADFHVFGQIVLGDGQPLPALPNLYCAGPFSSPLEWIAGGRFDAFLFTSRWEGLPNVLVEAGALGFAVIAPVVGGVGELITEATGYPLCEAPAVEDYVAALMAIRMDPAAAAQRAQALRQLVEERHAWPRFVHDLEALPDYLHASADPPLACPSPEAPAVSVIVPCYNQGHYLLQSVSTALAASTHPLEVIVVDDGSPDAATARWLAQAQALDPARVRIHRQANQGLSGARNAGLALARGRFIQFLDADDLLAPGKIDAQLAQFSINPEIDVSICNFVLADETCTHFSKPEEAIAGFGLSEADFLYRWERGMSIPIHCGLFRRRVVASFDTAARAKEDWLFWVGLSLDGVRFAYVHGHWAIYRQHAASMRRSYLRMGQAWLEAGHKINTRLAGREPLFFARTVDWFERCYRANPAYALEVRELEQAAQTPALVQGRDRPEATRHDPAALLAALPEDDGRRPRFSIIVPVFNHYDYLEGCLRSLIGQLDADAEVICIDDGSSDARVAEYLRALSGRHARLRVILSGHNRGISAAQNEAVSSARGAYLAFVDCDDALEPGALARVAAELDRHPETDYLFTDRHDVDATGAVVRVARYGGYDNLSFTSQAAIADDLYKGMIASHLKVIRRQTYVDVGGCDPRYDGVQDWDLALKIAAVGTLRYLPEPLYRHRVHGASVTSTARVAQMRLSNQVCRSHLERLRPAGVKAEVVRIALPADLAAVRKMIAQGAVCVADATGRASDNAARLLHLREFNAYFDRVEWDDPLFAAALSGYMWSSDALAACDAGSDAS